MRWSGQSYQRDRRAAGRRADPPPPRPSPVTVISGRVAVAFTQQVPSVTGKFGPSASPIFPDQKALLRFRPTPWTVLNEGPRLTDRFNNQDQPLTGQTPLGRRCAPTARYLRQKSASLPAKSLSEFVLEAGGAGEGSILPGGFW